MFTGITGIFPFSSNTDMGEQLLSSVASQGIRHLFSSSESVDVSIRCQPSSKLLQGRIDGLQMTGRGLVIRKDFPVEEMSFTTDAVAIDVAAVLRGEIRLLQPTQAIALISLSEGGINHAFKAQLVTKRLENLSVPALTEFSGGKPVSFQDVQVELLANNKIRLFATCNLGAGEPVPIVMTSTLAVERRRRITFSQAQFEPELVPDSVRDISEKLTGVLDEILNDMVDLDRFDLDGVKLRINRLETQGKVLLFSGYAQIEHFPRTS
ncbi:MAG: DUF2993 domain-containing protein [Hormoscilla sp. SP5CHS1]|nr:DUF2993 domain-containing protein [Hormoscilla sp. SP12CHS1]MBC6456242.1 DUF2993 domain-containing protein [Hormoscilla sp. SP5CHS1]